MKRDTYFQRAAYLYDSGEIDGNTYDAMCMNADSFCDEEDDDGEQNGKEV